ncbi:MAG: winged helix-turn-helix domain-containing protein [Actinomycetota bacterium]
MSIPTVYLVGIERLPLIPEYLNLGTVVVVAPDQRTLDAWDDERRIARAAEEPAMEAASATVIDLDGRRILVGGGSLPLSDLEFRVLHALLDPPGRAVSFDELRTCGWGGAAMEFDVTSVRALIQRLRAKLQVAEAPMSIVSVRGFGFRVEPRAAARSVQLQAL